MPVKEENQCGLRTEVYSRVVGYFRPVQNWNEGKKQEFAERETYAVQGENSDER